MADTYADADAVKVRLRQYEKDVTDDLINECVQSAEDIINNKLIETTLPNPTPDEIKRAATYYASADGLSVLFEGEEDSPSAVKWEKRANEIIENYINAHPTQSETEHYTRHNSDRNRAWRGSRNHRRGL